MDGAAAESSIHPFSKPLVQCGYAVKSYRYKLIFFIDFLIV